MHSAVSLDRMPFDLTLTVLLGSTVVSLILRPESKVVQGHVVSWVAPGSKPVSVPRGTRLQSLLRAETQSSKSGLGLHFCSVLRGLCTSQEVAREAP